MPEEILSGSDGRLPSVNYIRRGEGPVVVLVHGLGSRWQAFEPVVELLAGSHEVIAIDLPGFGESEVDERYPTSPSGYASWLQDLLIGWGIEQPHVVGNSMGGGIALELGRCGYASRVTAFSPIGFWRSPGRLWCVALLTVLRAAASTTWPLLSYAANLAPVRVALLGAVIGRPAKVSPDDARAHVSGLMNAPSFRGARDSFANYHLTTPDDVAALRFVETTIAWGTKDYLLTYGSQSRRARELMPWARHVDLHGLGHIPFSDDASACADVIVRA